LTRKSDGFAPGKRVLISPRSAQEIDWTDIGSWWFTKYVDPAFFAYVVVVGGACMGLALAAQIFISL
jgi:hypothetical protein